MRGEKGFSSLIIFAFHLIVGTALLMTKGAWAEQSMGGITLLSVEPRVVTPNGDNLNDVVFFKFDSALSGLPIESQVHDIHGAKVSGMAFNSDETALKWNGKDDNGRAVPAGIYIYSIKIGKKLATGTVVVAR